MMLRLNWFGRSMFVAAWVVLVGGGIADAKPKKLGSGTTTRQAGFPSVPSSDDRRRGDGARGRIEVTEDAARDAEATRNQRLRWAPF